MMIAFKLVINMFQLVVECFQKLSKLVYTDCSQAFVLAQFSLLPWNV